MNFRFELKPLANQKVLTTKIDQIKRKFLLFFFPFYPLKLFKSISMITLFAVFLAIRLGMSFLNVRLPGFGLSLSFAWLPLMVLSWYFGPVIGLFAGALMDTLAWALKPSTWFWLYAIQEPIVGLIAGLLGSIATLRKSATKTYWDLIIVQFVILVFGFITIYVLLTLLNEGSVQYDAKNKKIAPLFSAISRNDPEIGDEWLYIFKYLAIAFISAFVLFIEIFLLSYYINAKKKKKPSNNLIVTIYTALLCILSTMIFSFALGSYTAVKFLEFLGRKPTNYLRYGINYYLLPRVIKESIKTPIYILILSSVLITFEYVFINVKKISQLKWSKIDHFNENNWFSKRKNKQKTSL
ncbi:ECF transporter S component [Ureaplasma diversum]|uniref:ECF transporter S component n=1 Tax=Ureaplasma diversum NCTC 246 TaxID=1188241 RepID=A0A084EXQ2_9BACT|nr:ECF transporter S component [Ureaplasma diversum]KEZ22744.1 Hypothetical protein, predicted transmembrane protein [Ureaplasma diversum NCTC 246]